MLVELVLQEPTDIKRLTGVFMHAPWNIAFLPLKLNVAVSTDGINYSDYCSVKSPLDLNTEYYSYEVHKLSLEINAKNVRKIRVLKTAPIWHYAKNQAASIVVDEIILE